MIYSYTGSKARTKNYNCRYSSFHICRVFLIGGMGGSHPPAKTPPPHWKLWRVAGHSLPTGHSFLLPGNSAPSRLPPHQSSFAPVPFLF